MMAVEKLSMMQQTRSEKLIDILTSLSVWLE